MARYSFETESFIDSVINLDQPPVEAETGLPPIPGADEAKGPYHPWGATKYAGIQALRAIGGGLPSALGRLYPGKDFFDAIGETSKEFYDKLADEDEDVTEYLTSLREGKEPFLTEALGSAGPTTAGVAAWLIPVAGPAISTAMFYDLNTEEVYELAKSKGADEKTAQLTSQVGGIVNTALDMVGIGRIGKMFGRPIKQLIAKSGPAKAFIHFLGNVGLTSVIEGGTEGIQEVVAEISSDWASKPKEETADQFVSRMYDKRSELWDKAKHSAYIGGFMGGVFGGAGQVAANMRLAEIEDQKDLEDREVYEDEVGRSARTKLEEMIGGKPYQYWGREQLLPGPVRREGELIPHPGWVEGTGEIVTPYPGQEQIEHPGVPLTITLPEQKGLPAPLQPREMAETTPSTDLETITQGMAFETINEEDARTLGKAQRLPTEVVNQAIIEGIGQRDEFAAMDAGELSDWAADNDIRIPADITSHFDIMNIIKDASSAMETTGIASLARKAANIDRTIDSYEKRFRKIINRKKKRVLRNRIKALQETRKEYTEELRLGLANVEKTTKSIGQQEEIDGITRETAGEMIARGDRSVLRHIAKGVQETHGSPRMADAIRNQITAVAGKAFQKEGPEGMNRVMANYRSMAPEIDRLLEGESYEDVVKEPVVEEISKPEKVQAKPAVEEKPTKIAPEIKAKPKEKIPVKEWAEEELKDMTIDIERVREATGKTVIMTEKAFPLWQTTKQKIDAFEKLKKCLES